MLLESKLFAWVHQLVDTLSLSWDGFRRQARVRRVQERGGELRAEPPTREEPVLRVRRRRGHLVTGHARLQ